MRRVVAMIALAGCGRIGFAGTTDDASGDGAIGHDEDGDGVSDSIDVCPHLPGSQADGDGDGVGDDCDPEPGIGRQRVLMFATMQPGDQPLDLVGTAVWTQQADAIHLDANGFGGFEIFGLAFQDIRTVIGFDILSRMAGAPQYQIWVAHGYGQDPYNFVELNEVGTFAATIVTHVEGTAFTYLDQMLLATNIHPGPLLFQATSVANTRTQLDAGWPGETYTAMAQEGTFTGGDQIGFGTKSLELAIRYIWVVISP